MASADMKTPADNFPNISSEDGPDMIESLCMRCEEQGMTKLLLVRVPFFKEIVLMSFECPHCGFRNNEIQSGASIAPEGIKLEFAVRDKSMLNRQVILGETASYAIPELEFEVPKKGENGIFTTIEGLLSQAVDGLSAMQPQRHLVDPDTATKIDVFIAKLRSCLDGENTFTFIVTDPTGNSHIENVHAPNRDPDLKTSHFKRTTEMNEALGLTSDVTYADQVDPTAASTAQAAAASTTTATTEASAAGEVAPRSKDEILTIPDNCPNCQAPVDLHIKEVEIPHFKSIFIYAHNCALCGHRSNEIRAGGSIADKGIRFTLKLNAESEWANRDCLKSSSCVMTIPEIELSAAPTTLGGSFTTIEGLIKQVYDQLANSPFYHGDSSGGEQRVKMASFLSMLREILDGKRDATLILEDPAGNSFVQNLYLPEVDPFLTVEQYDRTEDDNEELGLTHMNTDHYE
eukprot:m.118151 g.118151  ORF g.118151 m.118151 type:complete len:460 (-) comp51999_c0_seq2:160-1539(-)